MYITSSNYNTSISFCINKPLLLNGLCDAKMCVNPFPLPANLPPEFEQLFDVFVPIWCIFFSLPWMLLRHHSRVCVYVTVHVAIYTLCTCIYMYIISVYVCALTDKYSVRSTHWAWARDIVMVVCLHVHMHTCMFPDMLATTCIKIPPALPCRVVDFK